MEKQSRALMAGFCASAIALVFFGWLANEVLRGETRHFDAVVRNAVHGWASPRLTYAMQGITMLGAPSVLVTITLFLIWRLKAARRHHAAVLLVVAALGATALNELLKLVFHRHRPEPFFGYPLPLTYSFPSGHSIEACCFYGVVAALLSVRLQSRPAKAGVWVGAALLALGVGLSRIYLGVHYPSDVLAGYTAAIIWVGAVRMGYEFWLRRRAREVNQNSSAE
jgi:undecaprenyl-diphosphatase